MWGKAEERFGIPFPPDVLHYGGQAYLIISVGM